MLSTLALILPLISLEKQDIIILRLYKMETPIGENRIN